MTERIAGVVLAAGTSTRMGESKLFLTVGGATLLRRVVDTAAEAGLDPIIVVLGHEAERARAELAGVRCAAVVNADYLEGINTSLRAGFNAVPDDATAAVMLLADMPFVSAHMIGTLVALHRAGHVPLVISSYAGVFAPPTLYGRALFDELRVLEGEGCGSRVAKQHRNEAAEVEWPASVMVDVDVPADLERVRAQMMTTGRG